MDLKLLIKKMGIIYILLPLSILLGLIGLIAFIWSVRSGQYDDLETPDKKILFDEVEKK